MKKIRGPLRDHQDSEAGSPPAGSGQHFIRPYLRLILCGLLLCASPRARSQSVAEYSVKLATLYNIAKFVEWPADAFPDPDAPLVICVVGADPFEAEYKEELRKRSAGGRPIDLKSIRSTDDLRACHMAFLSAAERSRVPSIVAGLEGSSTLTVSEIEGFAERGGIINLIVEAKKLHIEINLGAAKQNRLAISARLLQLARIINNPSRR